MDGLEVDDGCVTAQVEDVLPDSEIPSAATLFAREMGERVLDLHALAQAFAPLGGGDELAESMLQLFVVRDGDGATAVRGGGRALRAERTLRADVGVEFDDLPRHEGFGLSGRTCVGAQAHVDR